MVHTKGTLLPRALGHRSPSVRDAELFAPLWALLSSHPEAVEPYVIDAQSEWWALQRLDKTAREEQKAGNLPFLRRIRRFVAPRARGGQMGGGSPLVASLSRPGSPGG